MVSIHALRAKLALAAICVGAGLALGASSSGVGSGKAAVWHPVWREVKWPFSGDPWGPGKAYICRAADCGAEARIYLRAKMGLCNCATGIEDDADLDRMGDLYLLGGDVVPSGAGRQIVVGQMKGRSRAYALKGPQEAYRTAITIGYSDRCDMVVATGILQGERQDATEPAILEFLNSPAVLRWTETTLGL
jgi:hypothetical protein